MEVTSMPQKFAILINIPSSIFIYPLYDSAPVIKLPNPKAMQVVTNEDYLQRLLDIHLIRRLSLCTGFGKRKE